MPETMLLEVDDVEDELVILELRELEVNEVMEQKEVDERLIMDEEVDELVGMLIYRIEGQVYNITFLELLHTMQEEVQVDLIIIDEEPLSREPYDEDEAEMVVTEQIDQDDEELDTEIILKATVETEAPEQ